MIRVRQARVTGIESEEDTLQVLNVANAEGEARAICYPALTGAARPGDIVTLNTTAVALGLGTGGVHFVMAVWEREQEAPAAGHIMKVRYTPAQVQVEAVEEEQNPHHSVMAAECDLRGMPVAVATLHSLIAPFAVFFKKYAPHRRLAYIMTDGAALPAAFSRLLAALKQRQLIEVCITCGHAFGGDLEAVTCYSALQAAAAVSGCAACIVAMGPGVVGTGTPLGTTALEQAPLLDAAGALGARSLAVPRLSFADPRPRHQGISHHTLTALGRLAHRRTTVCLPAVDGAPRERLVGQLAAAGIPARHEIAWVQVDEVERTLAEAGVQVTSMGRSPAADPIFFAAGAAAGRLAAEWCG